MKLVSAAVAAAVGIAPSRSTSTSTGTNNPTTKPTALPTFPLWSGAGCPPKWIEGSAYKAKDLVTVENVVYQCSTLELLFVDQLCSLSSYMPGGSLYWGVAWTRLGSCDDGTIRPTNAPAHVALADIGGCPEEFSEYTEYEVGDRVQVNGVVFQCKEWPYSVYCNTKGYEPLGPLADSAWNKLGYCKGTMTPSSSPVFVSLHDHNGCPDLFDQDKKYESNDKVSTDINSPFSIVWQCSSDDHLSRYCQQFEPGHEDNLAWTVIGHCEGTMSPTTAPNFSELSEYEEGCPDMYDAVAKYESGDKVSYSITPGRTVVYVCKEWPYGAYCDAGELYAPGSFYDDLGWNLLGWCDGTIAPTLSPIELTGICEDDPWSFANLLTYVEGDQVRKGYTIYECREWPHSRWCTDANYEPENSQHWEQAWIHVGECETVEGASVSIEGTLTIDTSRRRSLVSIEGLNEEETDDLLMAAQETIEEAVCLNQPDEYDCILDILSVNDQPVSRRLSSRKLIGILQFIWIAQISFPTQGSNAEALANSVSTTVSSNLDEAILNNTLAASFGSKAVTHAVKNINFGATSAETKSPQVDLKLLSSRSRDKEGGEQCRRNNQCASKKCKRGAGGCPRRTKCCEPRLSGGERCKDNRQCISNRCVKGGGSCRWRRCCENPTSKPTDRPTGKPSSKPTKKPTLRPTANPTTGAPTTKPTRQSEFCVNFNDPFDLEGFAPCPGDYRNIDVKSSKDITWSADDRINPLSNDYYLHLKDQVFGSLACGTDPSYTGDWTRWTQRRALNIIQESAACHELCFDTALFNDPFDDGIRPSISLQGGAPDYYRASFKAYTVITEPNGSNPGWQRICAPISSLDSNGNLPSNNDGFWNMSVPHNILSGDSSSTPGSLPSPNSAWNSLLSNIAAIILKVDYTGYTTERIGYDNICLEKSVCPTSAPSKSPTNSPTASPTGCNRPHVAVNSPLNSEEYAKDIFADYTILGPNKFCYNDVLATIPGGPTTAHLLVMFRENFVEHKCKVYASLSTAWSPCDVPEQLDLEKGGLYEVIDEAGACVTYRLIYEDENIGQIVASSQFDPIEIIAVSGSTIFGYYPDYAASSTGGIWQRKESLWGDAIDGTLSVEPVLNGDVGVVSGLSINGRLFNMYGSFSDFNYAKHDDIVCSARPAEIGDWTGSYAGSRGLYCPKQSNSQLIKHTWHSSGSSTTNMGWAPAKKIGRLSPVSNIYGISTEGKIIVLWDEVGVAVHSVPLDLGGDLTGIEAIGGVDNGYARGIFAINDNDRIHNVYWDGSWTAKEVPLDYAPPDTSVSAWFGNFNDQTYILYGHQPYASCGSCDASYYLYRLDFVGGENRHLPVRVSTGMVPFSKRSKLCSTDSPSLTPSVTLNPSELPSSWPSLLPSKSPLSSPSEYPSYLPSSLQPSLLPSTSHLPTATSSGQPSSLPSTSYLPTATSSESPSLSPSVTSSPSFMPEFCVKFNDPADLEGFAPCPGVYENIVVRSSTSITSDDPINPLSNDHYLHLQDRANGSLACGTDPSYTGNWTAWTGDLVCHELCFDVALLFDTCNKETTPRIKLQGGAPNYYAATFIAYKIMTDSDGSSPGWRRICAPIVGLNSDGSLPSNGDGYWIMNAPHNVLSGVSSSTPAASPSPNTAWLSMLTNIIAIILRVDHTGATTERVGYDNICLKQTTCQSSVTSGLPSSQPSSFSPFMPSEEPSSDAPSGQPSSKPFSLYGQGYCHSASDRPYNYIKGNEIPTSTIDDGDCIEWCLQNPLPDLVGMNIYRDSSVAICYCLFDVYPVPVSPSDYSPIAHQTGSAQPEAMGPIQRTNGNESVLCYINDHYGNPGTASNTPSIQPSSQPSSQPSLMPSATPSESTN